MIAPYQLILLLTGLVAWALAAVSSLVILYAVSVAVVARRRSGLQSGDPWAVWDVTPRLRQLKRRALLAFRFLLGGGLVFILCLITLALTR